MKIMLSCHAFTHVAKGGGEVYVYNLAKELSRRGHEVIVLTSKERIACSNLYEIESYKYEEISVLSFACNPEKVTSEERHTGIGPVIKQALREIILKAKPDIVHINAIKPVLAMLCHEMKIPHVITIHHGGVVCPAGALLNHRDEICNIPPNQSSCLPCCVRDIRGGKFALPLLRVISPDIKLKLGRCLRERRFLYFITPLGTLSLSIKDKIDTIDLIGRYAMRIIAPSYAVRNALICNGISENKILVEPHGIPSLKRTPLPPDIESRSVRFLYLGRVCYIKGLHVMLEAFKKLTSDKFELNIVGGPVTKADQRYMKKMQLRYKSDKIIWHGPKSHDEIYKYINMSDVLVHPAICLEAFGLTISESLSVGRPVIATRCGGAEMQIRDEENGLLVAPNNPVELRNALARLIENPKIIQGLSGRAYATQTLEAHVNNLELIYRECETDYNSIKK